MNRKATWLRSAAAAAVLSAASFSAHAGWIVIADPDPTDTATNPDSKSLPGGQPASQSDTDLGLWLQDLLNLSTPPNFISGNDDFSGGTISSIPDGALYITLHYGNLTGFSTPNATIAYMCDGDGDCSSFTGYSTTGLSNYRIFGTPSTTSVPEPATLALMSLGLLGVGLSRRRRKDA